EDRRRNVRGAFSLHPERSVEGKTVLLVDDVCTSGATVNECSRVLKRNRAKRVLVATLARAVGRRWRGKTKIAGTAGTPSGPAPTGPPLLCKKFSTARPGKLRRAAPSMSPAAAGAMRFFSRRAAFKWTPWTFLRSPWNRPPRARSGDRWRS